MKIQDRFARSLEQEIEAVKRGLAEAEEVRSRMFEHDWEGLSEKLRNLDEISGEIAKLEERRHEQFQKLKRSLSMDVDAGFYAVVVRLPEDVREELSERFRTLKKAVLQFQGVTWSIDAYTRTMSSTFQEILYALYPHKRGTMYERSGRKRATENNPLVLNRQL
jgi:septal ring factor EnvC (AmiA/AmiB activator)